MSCQVLCRSKHTHTHTQNLEKMQNVTLQHPKIDIRFFTPSRFLTTEILGTCNTNTFSDYLDITCSLKFPLRFVYF